MKYGDISVGRALGIFSDIENPEISDREKGEAIYIILNRPHRLNEVKKEEMLRVMRWLWRRCFRVRKENGNDG